MTNDISDDMKMRFAARGDGQYRKTCPSCSHDRQKAHQSERVLSVRVEWPDVKWMCHHCGTKGGISLEEKPTNVVKFVAPVKETIRATLLLAIIMAMNLICMPIMAL